MAIQITININDVDEKILKSDLSNIQDWVQSAVDGKIDSCWGRMRQQWTQKLMEDDSFTESIPSNKIDFVDLVISRPDYKTRVEKDQENNI